MRVILTGQVGVDKGPYLDALVELARQNGKPLKVFHVGKMMYQEAPDVPAGRILNLPISRLNALRRTVFRDILSQIDKHENVIINTHATFRWCHGLFSAFDFDQIKAINADLYVMLLDNAETVYHRVKQQFDVGISLKDILVWREEEALATELLANIERGQSRFYLMPRGRQQLTVETLYRLMFEPKRKKVYLSFPMSHVMDLPDTLKEIREFKAEIQKHLTCFDPADVDEFELHLAALDAIRDGKASFEIDTGAGKLSLNTAEVASVSSDIMGQIYARDFKTVDQADMIISLVPELPNGKPGLSSGVERELQHAWEGGREVYVVWTCKKSPSPFITKTATKVFASTQEAIAYFSAKGYMG